MAQLAGGCLLGRHRASADGRKLALFTFLITGSKASAQPGVIPTDKVNRMRTGPAAITLLSHDRRGAQSDGLAAAWPHQSTPAAGDMA